MHQALVFMCEDKLLCRSSGPVVPISVTAPVNPLTAATGLQRTAATAIDRQPAAKHMACQGESKEPSAALSVYAFSSSQIRFCKFKIALRAKFPCKHHGTELHSAPSQAKSIISLSRPFATDKQPEAAQCEDITAQHGGNNTMGAEHSRA